MRVKTRGASGLGGKSELLVSYGLHYDTSGKRPRLENFFPRAQEPMDVDEPKSEANPSAGVPAPPAAAKVPEPTPAAPVPTPQEANSPAPAGVPDKPTVEKKAGGQGQRASIGQLHDSDWMLDTSGSVPQIKVVSTAAGRSRL